MEFLKKYWWAIAGVGIGLYFLKNQSSPSSDPSTWGFTAQDIKDLNSMPVPGFDYSKIDISNIDSNIVAAAKANNIEPDELAIGASADYNIASALQSIQTKGNYYFSNLFFTIDQVVIDAARKRVNERLANDPTNVKYWTWVSQNLDQGVVIPNVRTY